MPTYVSMAINPQKLLDDVEEAINRVNTTGQSGRIGDLEYSEANLEKLLSQRKRLINQINRANGKRPTVRKVSFS